MSGKIHWNLLILFGVLCQGIIGTLSEKNIDESSELHVRQKRVINTEPGGDQKESIRNFPYVVSIKGLRSNYTCAGVILTHQIVLTAARCVIKFEITKLKVYSGNAQAVQPRSTHADIHQVTDKRIHMVNHPFRPEDGIALVKVTPPFIYTNKTFNIEFYEGHVPPGIRGAVSGWGCNSEKYNPGTLYPKHLRTINVPIISNHECRSIYNNTFPIMESDICTLDASGHQYCGVDDAGAPLAVEVNFRRHLLGIHLWNGGVVGRANPDVFIDLRYPEYKHWIQETIRIMEASVHSQTLHP